MFALALLAAVGMSAVEMSAQVPQVLGVWELNLRASSIPAEVFPGGIKFETRSYAQRDDGYLVALVIREYGNGRIDFIQVVAKSDGKDYPQFQSSSLADLQIRGAPTRTTYSEKTTSANTAEVVARLDGRVGTRGTRRISDDGKTMTLNVAVIAPDGKQTPLVMVFRKRP